MPPLYVGAAVAFVTWAGVAWLGTKFFHLEGTASYVFVGALSALGISLWTVFYFYQQKVSDKFKKGEAPQVPGFPGAPADGEGTSSPELQQLLHEANGRFSQSSVGQGQTIANLPLIFMVGDRATAKTTTVMQSGIVPELLAGQVYQQTDIVPTRTGNVWFARGFAFVEAGGAVLGDPASWARLVKGLQPGKIKSLVGKGGQAPRGVVLCISLEAFLAPGASGALEAASRYLSARLGEISQILGISFPVYVLFTKADRVPFFTDYVRMLSNDEAGQVLGATLPMRDVHAGVFAEEETRRITDAFNQLFFSLCDNRVVYMPREDDPAVIPGAYEFPREFRKLRAPMVQFLVDICRPSQLRVSPFLRGFYFSGARPVVVSDVNMARSVEQRPQGAQEEFGGATSMFRVGMKEEMLARQSVAQSQPSARKVPQWVFLTHLFHGLIMQDSAAMGASGASVKTSLLRRVLFAAATGLFLLISALFTISYFGNNALETEALNAARNITGSGSSEPVLRRLDTLRQALEKLTGYEHNGHPFQLGFGLYAGSRILPDVRQVYYNKFKQVLFGETQNGMLAFMKSAPPIPGPADDYGAAYNILKSYLLTTGEYKRTTDKNLQTFLGENLNARWRRGKEDSLTKERSDLARAQFDFYSRDLHNGNPYSSQGDVTAIEHTRLHLSKFSGVERVYQFLLAEVNKGHTSESFNDHFKGSASVVTSSHPVSFVYTKPGSDAMLKAVHEARFGGEQWVLGNYQTQTVDKAGMEGGVMSLYTRDFIKQWRTVIQTSRVNPYTNLMDASNKLTTLSGNEAPLLALFWWTSQNTNVEIPEVVAAFQSVRQVVPPSSEPRFVVAANQNYNNGLVKLQSTIAQAAAMPNGPDPAAAAATQSDAANAKLVTRQLTASFPVDSEHLEAKVNDLMLEPITNAEALAKGMGAAEINGKGKALCSAMNLVTSKFPFNPAADPEVTLDELNSVFKAKDGKLWQFYESGLKNFIVCTGADCVVAQNPPAPVEARFLAFFRQAAAFSKALYGDSGTDPNFRYTMRPIKSDLIDEFDLTVNGDTAHLNGGGQRTYAWPGAGTPGFHLDLKLNGGGNPIGGEPYTGLWAVFRFFADADRTDRSGAGYDFTWNPRQGKRGAPVTSNGKPLSYQFFVDTNGAPAVFSKDFLAGLKCAPTVVH